MNKFIKNLKDSIKNFVTTREFLNRLVTGTIGFFGLFFLYFFCSPDSVSWFLIICLIVIYFEVVTLYNKIVSTVSYCNRYSNKRLFTAAIMCLFYPLFLITDNPVLRPLLPLLFIMVIGNDIGAYIVGKLFGRHKLAPTISPNKTVEGLLGGCAFTLLVTSVYVGFFTAYLILFCLLVSVLATAGDLLESYFKRKAGVKDSGFILPGHGGLLDRFDSILPVSIFFYMFSNAILKFL